MNIDDRQESYVKTNLQTKYYQQALYYYFQGNYPAALNIISESKIRLSTLDQTSQLFEAGLQVKMGLQEQAKQTLLAFSNAQREEQNQLTDEQVIEKQVSNSKHNETANELLVLALLSLTEQFIAQGEFIQAQQTLAKISRVTQRFYQQYHVLSQLAYWPEQPDLLPLFVQETSNEKENLDANLNDAVFDSPYIQLNKALRFIEKEEFASAISLLTIIKSRHWQAPEQTFWQSLFTEDVNLSLEKQTEAQLQNQTINDYARLLLAQVYAKQEAYEKAFVELEAFPQQSPYTESALFLFAFSAQKVKQHTIALSLLTLLHKQYPYSHLGWQAGLLMAKQAAEQKGLAQGWQVYQNVEQFFLERIEKLNQFERNYSANTDLLTFSNPKTALNEAIKNHFATPVVDGLELEAKPYTPESVWLQQAMYAPSLNSLYQQLSELTVFEQHNNTLQNKSDWIKETIKLNMQRKARIAASQAAMDQQGVYQKLIEQRENLASALTIALSDPQQRGFAFANEEEQVLLDRLDRSKENLAYIVEHSDDSEQANIDDYQQRLTRLSAVLTWQLKQQYPQRAWQHKQQLVALDQNLKDVETLQNKISLLITRASTGQIDHSLSQLTDRQIKADKKISPLTKQFNQLKSKISLSIRNKIARYIDEQRNVLTQHLLTTRSAMADVLEQMSINDKKIENQLNLDVQAIEEQSL
mgnify:CR=1 FL=1